MLLVQFLAQYFIMALALDKQQGWIQDFQRGGGGGGGGGMTMARWRVWEGVCAPSRAKRSFCHNICS